MTQEEQEEQDRSKVMFKKVNIEGIELSVCYIVSKAETPSQRDTVEIDAIFANEADILGLVKDEYYDKIVDACEQENGDE